MDPKSTAAIEHRAWNYWFDDGLPSIVGGVGWVLAGLCFIFSSLSIVVFVALSLIIIGNRSRSIIAWLKLRLTYPRTGYVAPPSLPQDELSPPPDVVPVLLQGDPVRRAKAIRPRTAGMIGAVMIFMVWMLVQMTPYSRWLYAIMGVCFAVWLWILNGRDFRLSCTAIGGVALIGLGMAIFLPSSLTPFHGLGYLMIAVGLLMSADGAVALVRHLRRNPMVSVSTK